MWNMWNVLESVPTHWCHLVPITSTHLIWLICGAPWCSMVQLFVLLCRPLPGLADGRHFRYLSIRSGSRCKDLLKVSQNGCFSSNYIPTCQFFPLSQSQDVSSWQLLAGPSAEHNQDVSEQVHLFESCRVLGQSVQKETLDLDISGLTVSVFFQPEQTAGRWYSRWQ